MYNLVLMCIKGKNKRKLEILVEIGVQMRKEASFESWKELYEVTLNIKELAPWKNLWDSDLIAICLPGREEPVFCSILGRGGACFGISAYVGLDGLADFNMLSRSEESHLPVDFVMFEQSNLSCYFGSRDEVPNEQKKVIKALDLKFRGDKNWAYFESYKKGYMPYILDSEEVTLLIAVYKNLYMALRAFVEQGLVVDFDHGNCLWRTFSKEKELWLNFEAPIPVAEKKNPHVELKDELQKRMLKNQPKLNAEIILELAYMNAYVKDPDFERPLNPMLFLAMDAANGTIIAMDTIKPDDDITYVILNFVGNFILQHGRMKTIIARIPIIHAVLEDTCKYCGIKLLGNDRRLGMLDEFLFGLKNRMR